jgi:hypothetical protein
VVGKAQRSLQPPHAHSVLSYTTTILRSRTVTGSVAKCTLHSLGMPPSILSQYDASSISHPQPPRANMTMVDTTSMLSPASRLTRGRDPKICPTDDEAIIPKSEARKRLNKQSWEYIIKSGVAGGLAGCAVCLLPIT